MATGGSTGALNEWAARAVARAVDDPTWEPLLESLHRGVREQVKQLSVGKRFSELTESEQAALVERSFHETQQSASGSELVTKFSHRLGKAVTDEMLEFLFAAQRKSDEVRRQQQQQQQSQLQQSSFTLGEHPSNADQMLELFSKTVINMLEASPPEMATTLRLFVNRPLPDSLRSSIWVSCLTQKLAPVNRSGAASRRAQSAGRAGSLEGVLRMTGKLAPSLDILMARRCHSLLDCNFVELSSRTNAAFVKVVVSNFMRMLSLKMPAGPSDSFAETDQLACLAMPLVCAFRLSAGNRKRINEAPAAALHVAAKRAIEESRPKAPKESDVDLLEDGAADSRNFMDRPNAIELALYTLLEPKHMGLLGAQEGRFFLVDKAPGVSRILSMLLLRDPRYTRLLQGLRYDGSQASAVAAALANSGDAAAASGDGGQSGGPPPGSAPVSPRGALNGISLSPAIAFSTAPTLEGFINELVKRGLAGLLSMRTCLFVWDQGFVVGFGAFMPLVLVSLFLGAAEELRGLNTLKAVYETFTSYCQSVTTESLQRLLSTHCAAELGQLFDSAGSYALDLGETGALQAVHKQVLSR